VILCCAGSRDLIHADHCVLMAQAIERWIARNGTPTLIMHGDCRDREGNLIGGDAFGEHYALTAGIHFARVPAWWKRHGNGAGPRRNAPMISVANGLCVVRYPDSRGSADVLRRAVAKWGEGSGLIEDVVIGRCE
jgi:hypothetical protein